MHLIQRLATLGLLLAGLTVYWLVIPAQVEEIDYGTLSPRTIPRIATGMIVVLAALQLVLRPVVPGDPPDATGLVGAGLVFVFVLLAVLALPWIGFLPVAIALALGLCLFVGERRLLWLCVAVAILPPAIWTIVTVLLDRSLP